MAGDMLGKRLLPRLGLVVFVVVGIFVTSELRLSSIRQRLLAFAPRFDRVSCDYGGLLPPVHQDDPRSVPRRSSQAHPACTSMRAAVSWVYFLVRSVCPVASHSVGDLVHAGFEPSTTAYVWRTIYRRSRRPQSL